MFISQIGFLSSALCPCASKGTDLRWPCFGLLSSLCAGALSCRHIFQGTLSLSYIRTSRAWEIILLCSSGDGAQALRHAKKELYSSCQLLKRRSRIDAVTQSLVGWRQDLLFLIPWFCLVLPGIPRVFTPPMNLHRYQLHQLLQMPGLLIRDTWEGWPHCVPAEPSKHWLEADNKGSVCLTQGTWEMNKLLSSMSPL